LVRYVHIGTGNYNDVTAKLYTDAAIMTANPIVGNDASALFNKLTGYFLPYEWEAFSVSPLCLKQKLFKLIDREIKFARSGHFAQITAKMNSLSSRDMIDKLYEASQAGVSITLIVRGICCLRPGMKGLSDNITVVSIVDRFLEHSRIISFHNGGNEEIYLSSADWMTRNLEHRVELLCPVFDSGLRAKLRTMLEWNRNDNVKGRLLLSTGEYVRKLDTYAEPLRSQEHAMQQWRSLTPNETAVTTFV